MCTIKAKRHDNDNDNGIANLSFIEKEGFMPLVATFHQCRSDLFVFRESRFHRLLCPVKSNESPVSDPSASRFDPCQSRRPYIPPLGLSDQVEDSSIESESERECQRRLILTASRSSS
jgi:hypothetical protein